MAIRSGTSAARVKRVAPAGLDHETILIAADRVLRRGNLAGFSMRKLAAALGTTPMAVYRYFPDKAALLDALADRAMEGIDPPMPRGAGWQVRARGVAQRYRARLLASPALVQWLLGRVTVSPGALRQYDAALAIVRESGLSDRDVVRVVDATVSYVLGFAAIEVARQGLGAQERGYRALAPWFQQLSPRALPALVALASHAGDFDDELFDFGLDLLLAGAEARVMRSAAGGRHDASGARHSRPGLRR